MPRASALGGLPNSNRAAPGQLIERDRVFEGPPTVNQSTVRRQPDAVVLDIEFEHRAINAGPDAIWPVWAWDQGRA